MKKFFLLLMMSVLSLGVGWAATGTITFGNNGVKIDNTSVTDDDDRGNTWTITTTGTTSFTQQPSYSQVGSSKAAATSITFTTTLPSNVAITAMSAKFGGFSGTAGTISLKVGDTEVGTGSLNASNDVTVNATSTATGKVLTVTVTDIAKGVKCYNISYTYNDADPTQPSVAPTATVSFSPASGSTVLIGGNVTISLDGEASGIKYTLNGTDPVQGSATYSAPFALTGDDGDQVTIKAVAYNTNGTDYAAGTVATATYTLKAPATTPYSRVTSISSADLGRKFILVYEGSSKAMGAVNTYGNSEDVTINDRTINLPEGSAVVPVTLGGEDDAWTFDTGSGLLAWSNKTDNHNNLYADETGSTWKVTFDGNNAEIRPTNDTAGTRVIQYNTGSPRFACYTGSQKAIQLYREVVADELAAPEISGNANFVGSTEVTITAAEGASIYYTTDGTEPTTASTLYSAAFTINATTTVKAIAVLDGKTSGVASKTFTAIASVASIAEFNELADNEVRAFSNPVVALKQWGNNNQNLYVQERDGSKGMLIYGATGQTYNLGDVIPAGFSGTRTVYSGAPELVSPTGFQASTENAQPTPVELTPEQVNLENFGRYAIIKGATFDTENTKIVVANESVTYFNTWSIDIPTEGTYDVIGIVSYHNAPQFLPLSCNEVQAEAVPDYYLVGSFNMEGDNWITDDENYKFTKQAAGGYKLADVTLPDNVEFKIVKKEDGNITAWLGGASNEETYGIHGGWHADMPLNGENTAKNFSMAAGGVCTLTISDDMKLTVDKQPSMAISASFNNWGKTAMTASDEG